MSLVSLVGKSKIGVLVEGNSRHEVSTAGNRLLAGLAVPYAAENHRQ